MSILIAFSYIYFNIYPFQQFTQLPQLSLSLFESAINSEVFTAWVKQDLIPKLPKKSVVLMDNATFHKQSEMQEALANAGHTLLYFPPYSPDLNPIEKKWAHAKSIRRKFNCSIDALFRKCLTYNILD